MHSTDPWEQRADQFTRHPLLRTLQWGLGITAIVLVIVAVVGLATTGSIFFQAAAAKRTVGAKTDIKVYSADNKIAQIAFFHNTCQDVNRQARIVENNQARYNADLKAAQFAKDPIRQQQAQQALSQDQQDVTGALNVLQGSATDYNSRSAQSTANVFKGANLPERINVPNPLPPGWSVNCG